MEVNLRINSKEFGHTMWNLSMNNSIPYPVWMLNKTGEDDLIDDWFWKSIYDTSEFIIYDRHTK